eukprot:TRINITY_DN23419_c0_g1_i1.p1 TRINITY_DN23419_c0_g1~~TRINITY_DN23419_c0_g1_i1.p1  ORF type:complete len:327 (-),score=13.11 TRINITY_DN23419_c0_g1_i1:66-1046(-)
MACCGFGFGTSTEPIAFNVAFGTSGCLTNRQLLAFRAVVAVVFFGHGVWSLIRNLPLDGFYYWIYLTHWSLWLEVAYTMLLVPVTYACQASLEKTKLSEVLEEESPLEQGTRLVEGTDSAPFLSCCTSGFSPSTSGGAVQGNLALPDRLKEDDSKIADIKNESCLNRSMMVIFQIVNPLALSVVLLYWTLVRPVWKLCPFYNGEDCRTVPDYLGFFVHGIDWILMTILFLVGRVPYYLSNALWLTAGMLVYAAWTYIHFLLKIGLPSATPCDDYPLNECPIYNALDWHNPTEALALVAQIVLVGTPVLSLTYKGLARLRDSCGRAE